MRCLFGFLCVCALGAMPLVGCSETGGEGGSGGSAGDGGSGGSAGAGRTVGSACDRELCDGVDCDDADPCTEDRCSGADGTCSYLALCDDFNDCTTETCDPGNESCSTPTSVADGTSCTGGTCQSGVCVLSGTVLPCTEQGIRNAIAAGDASYTFACDGTAPVVTQAEIRVHNDVILDGEGKMTVDGNCNHRVFLVDEGVTAELHGLTVARGGWVEPGAFDEHGGGISNKGTLTLTNCSVTQCSVPPSANPMAVATGGGINNDGTLTLTNCTVSENSAEFWGGGISSGGTLTMTNSTVSGNSPVGVHSGGTATLTNTTVSGNAGGGILNGPHTGIMFLENSTVSGNISSGITPENLLFVANSLIDGDCTGDVISYDFNIESPGDTCRFPREFDQPNVSAEDLNLGELANNGGPTMTHKPGDGGFGDDSVAIDAVPNRFCDVNLTEDQRGKPRPETGGTMCDVGSVEVQP